MEFRHEPWCTTRIHTYACSTRRWYWPWVRVHQIRCYDCDAVVG